MIDGQEDVYVEPEHGPARLAYRDSLLRSHTMR